MSSQPVTFADRATIAIAYGIPVMPLIPRTKQAFLDKWQTLATTDSAHIAEWNQQNHEYNCGAVAQHNGFWIFDIDSPTLIALIETKTGHKLSELDTLVVRSSGEKRHYYFKHNKRSEAMGNVKAKENGVEIFSARCHNEYVVGAGSIHPDTGLPYEIISEPMDGKIPEAPDWLINWILPYKAKASQQMAEAAAECKVIREGGRDEFLFKQACRLRDDGRVKPLVLAMLGDINRLQCSPPMSDKVVEQKVESAFTRPPRSEANEPMPAEPDRWEPKDAAHIKPTLEFHLPAVENPPDDEYVLAPSSGQTDGWFPRGHVSLIGAPSGGSKTTVMFQLLVAQRSQVPFFTHATFGRSFVVIGVDRGPAAHRRTLRRMHLSPESIPFIPIPSKVFDLAAAQTIVNAIEALTPMPEVVFIEGIDMLVTKPIDMIVVSSFMYMLCEFARRYHIAVIGSGGAPKTREGNTYVLSRDNFFGSIAWGRTAETMVELKFPKKNGKNRRLLHAELRNAAPEDFTLEFQDGILVVVPNEPEDTKFDDDEQLDLDWYKTRARLARKDSTQKWWTVLEFARSRGISPASAARHVDHDCAKGHITQKPGKRTSGKGGAHMYCWNETDTNPLWQAQYEQEVEEQANAF